MIGQRSFLICIEGLDRCGKGTVIEHLKGMLVWLVQMFQRGVVFTEEPNEAYELGSRIRQILGHKIPAPNAYILQSMFVCNRADHQKRYVRPMLDLGKTVFMDRGPLSTIAYGVGDTYTADDRPDVVNAINTEDIIKLHEELIGPDFLLPDFTILLDLSAEQAMRRSSRVPGTDEYFEKQSVLERVRSNYLALAKQGSLLGHHLGKFAIVNAAQSREDVLTDVIAAIIRFKLDSETR